jgi:hypothetical protein
MKENPVTITIDEVEYVRKDSINKPATKLKGMTYVIVRATGAGCHAGYLKEQTDTTVILLQSRRLYYWDGAATLSQMAMDGVTVPGNCKFPCPVDEITIAGWCEIIPCSEKARESIQGVTVWKR